MNNSILNTLNVISIIYPKLFVVPWSALKGFPINQSNLKQVPNTGFKNAKVNNILKQFMFK